MIEIRIFTQSGMQPLVLSYLESDQPQIQIELADGTRLQIARFAEGRAEIMVSGLMGDEVHIRPRSNVFDVITAPADGRSS